MPFIYGQADTGRPLEAPGQMAGYRTAGQVSVEGLERGLGDTSEGMFYHWNQTASADMEGHPMTEQAWKDSAYYRPGINFQPGWTSARAELEADRWDNKQAFNYHAAQHPVFALAGYGVGTLIDPMNLVPFAEPIEAAADAFKGVRIADAVSNALKMSRAARMAEGVVSGAGVGSMYEAANMGYQASEGKSPDWKAALLHVSAIAALGGLGRAFTGGFVKKAGIVNKAIDDLENDRPIQVDQPIAGHGDFTASQPKFSWLKDKVLVTDEDGIQHYVNADAAPRWKKTTIDGQTQYIDQQGDLAPEGSINTMEDIDEATKQYTMAHRLAANCLGIS